MTEKNKSGDGRGMAKSSQLQLKEITSSERARELQKKSVAARIRNREKREFIKLFAKEIKEGSIDVENDMPSGLQVLNLLMIEALESGDHEAAAKHAATLAEYQDAKLTRQEVTQTNVNLTEMSDEELAEYERLMKEQGGDS